MREAYSSLQLLSETSGDLWLVFAGMGELGEQAEAQHYQLGKEAAELGLHIISVGEDELAQSFYKGAMEAKLNEAAVFHSGTQAEAQEILQKHLKTKDKILFKASRAAGLDRLFQQFI